MKTFTNLKSVFYIAAVVSGSALIAASSAKIANANEFETACASGARPLADVMKDMGGISAKLSGGLADATKNADSITAASQLEQLSIESLALCVPKLEAMTDVVAKHGEYLEYQKMISQLFVLEINLEEALLKNDNAGAVSVFGQMRELQRAAHARFRG